MGAVFNESIEPGDTPAKLLNRLHEEDIKASQHSYGHAGYSGTFAESSGITVREETFKSLEEARQWVQDNHEKWEPCLAVKVFEHDKAMWLIGGWMSS